MTYIKKLVMHGFKSFAQKTEIPFDKGINVIIGPNGSGKSNISDALCFVLGRLSTKSIRAAKAKNLLFMGSKYVKPAREGSVEIVFDNTNRTFAIDNDEVILTRIVRHNGLSIYKLNNEVKTRAEVIEALAQAGIDPHGFNLILQGQIQSVVRMHPEDRRRVIEEVAGISIYETRKLKSLHELEKTEEKLREISAILRERTTFLKNLDGERAQALKFKELEETIRRCKASILYKKMEEKNREIISVKRSIDEKSAQKEKLRAKSEALRKNVESINERISQINKHIQHATGVEQETLHTHVANLKAELEGLRVRKENFEHRKAEIERRIEQMSNSIPEYEKDIAELRKESPLVAKKQTELAKKKQELLRIEEERKQAYSIRTELSAIKERIKDKEAHIARINGESDAVLKQIEDFLVSVIHKDTASCKKAITELSHVLESKKRAIIELNQKEIESAKVISVCENEISSAEKIKSQVESIDKCPLCQSKMTAEHISHVYSEMNGKMNKAKEELKKEAEIMEHSRAEYNKVSAEIKEFEKKIYEAERELVRHNSITDKQEYLKKLIEQAKIAQGEIKVFEQKRDNLQQKTADSSRLEEQHSSVIMEIEEISSRTEENIDNTLISKERELDRIKEVIKGGNRDMEEVEGEIEEFSENLENKTKLLQKKEREELELAERFKKLFRERDELQDKIQKESYEEATLQSETREVEEQINYLRIGDAKLRAEHEAVEMELREFAGVEIIKASLNVLEEKLQKATIIIQTIGSINLRALEVYDDVKKEYDRVQEKVNTIQKEKEDILRIIDEIDRKKKRTFMKTLNQINELFTSNYSRLTSKGQASLEIENPEDIFSAGVRIVIRVAKGKYFDVTSLSGGEQTLVALSLLFAIQEYKPYHFYIFDEIDAALDKRNSERLSALLKQYMKSGQYITITHNDSIIMDSRVLYGVSMHDGVSKVLSLNLDKNPQK